MRLSSLLSAIAACMAALLGVSCVPMDPYYADSRSVYTSPGTTVYQNVPAYGYGYDTAPAFFGASPAFFGGGNGYGRVCSVCRRNPCSCSISSRRRNDDNCGPSNSSRPKDSKGDIRLIRGSDSDRPNRPTGSHPREWYEKRGYDLKNYTYKDEAGRTFKKKK